MKPKLAPLPVVRFAKPVSQYRKIMESKAKNVYFQNAIADEANRRAIRSEMHRLEGLLITSLNPGVRHMITARGQMLEGVLQKKVV